MRVVAPSTRSIQVRKQPMQQHQCGTGSRPKRSRRTAPARSTARDEDSGEPTDMELEGFDEALMERGPQAEGRKERHVPKKGQRLSPLVDQGRGVVRWCCNIKGCAYVAVANLVSNLRTDPVGLVKTKRRQHVRKYHPDAIEDTKLFRGPAVQIRDIAEGEVAAWKCQACVQGYTKEQAHGKSRGALGRAKLAHRKTAHPEILPTQWRRLAAIKTTNDEGKASLDRLTRSFPSTARKAGEYYGDHDLEPVVVPMYTTDLRRPMGKQSYHTMQRWWMCRLCKRAARTRAIDGKTMRNKECKEPWVMKEYRGRAQLLRRIEEHCSQVNGATSLSKSNMERIDKVAGAKMREVPDMKRLERCMTDRGKPQKLCAPWRARRRRRGKGGGGGLDTNGRAMRRGQGSGSPRSMLGGTSRPSSALSSNLRVNSKLMSSVSKRSVSTNMQRRRSEHTLRPLDGRFSSAAT